jgi:hypothetical protein
VARHGQAGQAWLGPQRLGTALQGRRGAARLGPERLGTALQGRRGTARHGKARRGAAFQGRHGSARQGKAGEEIIQQMFSRETRTTSIKHHNMKDKTQCQLYLELIASQ